jgi:hypothetical protein
MEAPMFVGHTAVALAAKKVAPDVSLGLLVGAAGWLDLMWPIFLLLGVERVRIDPGNTAFTPLDFTYYPWTHSLVMALVWSAAFALACTPIVRRTTERVVLAALVFSHWVLDLIVHRPDLPLWPDDAPKVGLGLWSSIAETVLAESLLLIVGLSIYLGITRPRNGIGRYALWALIVVQVVIWLSGAVSAPPRDARTLAWAALAGWLFPLWAWWVDRHRAVERHAQIAEQ